MFSKPANLSALINLEANQNSHILNNFQSLHFHPFSLLSVCFIGKRTSFNLGLWNEMVLHSSHIPLPGRNIHILPDSRFSSTGLLSPSRHKTLSCFSSQVAASRSKELNRYSITPTSSALPLDYSDSTMFDLSSFSKGHFYC